MLIAGVMLMGLAFQPIEQISAISTPNTIAAGTSSVDGYSRTVLSDGPIAYWRLDEALGSATVADATGHGYAGTLQGGITLGATGVVSGNTAGSFDGASGRISVAITSGLPGGGSPYSLEAWAKPTGSSAQGIVGMGDYASAKGSNALRTGGASGLLNYWWGDDLVAGTADLRGAWHHVVATFDGSTRRLYLDGAQIAQDTPGTPAVMLTDLRLGQTCCNELFAGALDEVAIYPRALDSSRVQLHYVTARGSATPTTASSDGFVRAIDTQKESMDTLANRLTAAQMADSVGVAAQLNLDYVTVETPYDYPDYAQQWVDAIRSVGKHVWFRMSWSDWLGIHAGTGTMTPTDFLSRTQRFILAHPGMFRTGDIFDICPEPEQGKYWNATYGSSWNWLPAPPNPATREYNLFIRNGTQAARTAFQQIGRTGVTTTIRSLNPFDAQYDLEPATVSLLGVLTIDSYADAGMTDQHDAVASRINELNALHDQWKVPIVYGEMGYDASNPFVSDAQQQVVLNAEFSALRQVSFLKGVNYYVGAGYPAPDNYNGTRIFAGTRGAWTLRPAAADLARFFALYAAH
jgi:hypothetical protein